MTVLARRYFKVKEENSGSRLIYEVPYYPQTEAMSCWHFASKMILNASSMTHKLTGRKEETWRYNGLKDDSYYQKNYFAKAGPKLNTKQINSFHQIAYYMRRYGPLLVSQGHAFVIVGYDLNKRKLYVHYTLPISDDRNGSTGKSMEPKKRFWCSPLQGVQDNKANGWQSEQNMAFLTYINNSPYSDFQSAEQAVFNGYARYTSIPDSAFIDQIDNRYYFAEFFNKDLQDKATYLEVDMQFFSHIHQGDDELELWYLDVSKKEQELDDANTEALVGFHRLFP